MMLLDVLEHVPQPAAFVTLLANAFPHCQHVLITVPARQELWSNYDRYYGHYRRYDLSSGPRLFPSELFELMSARYAFRLLYAPALLLAKLRLDRSVSIAAPSPLTRPIHRALAGYFRLESVVVSRRAVGTSLILTLKRRAELNAAGSI
jgi:hypothetical protein